MNANSVSSRSRFHLSLLALIVALAAVLRIFSLSALGFWTDEFCSLSCSHGWGLQFDNRPMNQITPAGPTMTRLADARPFSQIIPAMVRDEAHPPLYFLMLRGVEDIFGDSELAVRTPNVIFSIIAIVLLFLTARESAGATVALWACLLMAVAEPQIQFSQEARNYMPVVTFSLLGFRAVQQLKTVPKKRHAVVLGIALLAMMLTHYFAIGVAISLGIYLLTWLRRTALRLGLISMASSAALFLMLWGPSLWRQHPHFQSNYAWISDTGPGHAMRVMRNLLSLPWRLITEWPQQTGLQTFAWLAGVVFYCFLAVLFIRRSPLRPWICWIVCAIGLVFAADLLRSTAQLQLVRYTLFATPAVYVVIAAAVERGRWRWILPASAVMLALANLPSAYVPGWKTDFRTPVQFVGRHLENNDGLVIIGSDPISDGIMFGAFAHYLPAMPATTGVFTRAADAAAIARLEQCPQVWIIQLPPDHFQLPRGFIVQDHQSVPYFADLIRGRFGGTNAD